MAIEQINQLKQGSLMRRVKTEFLEAIRCNLHLGMADMIVWTWILSGLIKSLALDLLI